MLAKQYAWKQKANPHNGALGFRHVLALGDSHAERLQHLGAPAEVGLLEVDGAAEAPVPVAAVEDGLVVDAALGVAGDLEPGGDGVRARRGGEVDGQPHVGEAAVPQARPRAVHHFRAEDLGRHLPPAPRHPVAVLLDLLLAPADVVAEL